MRYDIVTLFPEMFSGPLDFSIVGRAKAKGLIEMNLVNLRDFANDERGTVDDKPYGGGVGMILKVEPVFKAIKKIKSESEQLKNRRVTLLDPRGKKFDQKMARGFAKLDQIVFICGRYEGVDQRVADYIADESVSIGDYVLTGGELPTMVIVDSVTRLLSGVISKPEATLLESFSNTNEGRSTKAKDLEHPQYTRPPEFNGWKVPEILLSGDHGEIDKWRLETNKDRN